MYSGLANKLKETFSNHSSKEVSKVDISKDTNREDTNREDINKEDINREDISKEDSSNREASNKEHGEEETKVAGLKEVVKEDGSKEEEEIKVGDGELNSS